MYPQEAWALKYSVTLKPVLITTLLQGSGAASIPLGLHGARTDTAKAYSSHSSSEMDVDLNQAQPSDTDQQRETALERRKRRMASWGKQGSFPVVTANLEELKPNNLDF